MNPSVLERFNKPKDLYENLKREYDSIKSDMYTISTMEISDDAKKTPIRGIAKADK